MSTTSWNGMVWNTVVWDSYASTTPPTPLPPLPPLPPPPVSLRVREHIRRVGVVNATLMQEAVTANQESILILEFPGISGLDEINPKDVDC